MIDTHTNKMIEDYLTAAVLGQNCNINLSVDEFLKFRNQAIYEIKESYGATATKECIPAPQINISQSNAPQIKSVVSNTHIEKDYTQEDTDQETEQKSEYDMLSFLAGVPG